MSVDANGEPLGSIPVGLTWTVVVDTPGLRLVKPDGSRGERRLGISAVSVTEGRFAMANGRRYRGRVNVIRDPAGLTLMNRVPVESYLAGVIGGEMGPRRPDERQAMLAQAVVSRSFALAGAAGRDRGSTPGPTCAIRCTRAWREKPERCGTPCAPRAGRSCGTGTR